MALAVQLEYKYNFAMWFIGYLVVFALQIVFMHVLFDDNSYQGWDFNTSLILVATSRIVPGIASLSFFNYMYTFSRKVRTGEYDSVLTKPVNTQFWTTLSTVDLEDFGTALGIILLIYAGINTPGINLLSVLLYLVTLLLGILILYSIVLFTQTLAFFVGNVESAEQLIWEGMDSGGYPLTLLKGTWFQLFMFVIPIGLMMALPTEFLAGNYLWSLLAYSAILTAILLWASHKFFRFGLSRYASAGG